MNMSMHSNFHYSWLTTIFTGNQRQCGAFWARRWCLLCSSAYVVSSDYVDISINRWNWFFKENIFYCMQHELANKYRFILMTGTYESKAVLWMFSKRSKSIQGYKLSLFHNPERVWPAAITVPASTCGNSASHPGTSCFLFLPYIGRIEFSHTGFLQMTQ